MIRTVYTIRDKDPDMAIDRRSLLRSALIATALTLPAARRGRAADVGITDAAGLAGALAAATGGETLRLAPGDYGRLALDARRSPGLDFPRPVTLISADPADPAIFTEAALHGVGNLVLDGLRFDYRYAPGDKIYKRMFDFRQCRGLTIRNSVFDGDVPRGLSPEDDGVGYGIGLSVPEGRDVSVLNNRIQGFNRGLVMGRGVNAVIAGNELVGMRLDAMNFVAMQDVRIEGNYLHGFRRSKLKPGHSDMIQFWTNGSETPSTGITIRGNLLLAGDGDSTQSIFMRNDMVDRGLAGPEMFYRDVLIEENAIVNGHLHGITLGETKGATIRRNTLLRDPAFAIGPDLNKKVRIPRIRVSSNAVEVVVADNVAYAVPPPQPSWRVERNLLVQDRTRTEPGFYDQFFETRPGPAAGARTAAGRPVIYVPVRVIPGSPADRPGLGAALMR
jgi:Right handed beta helix region